MGATALRIAPESRRGRGAKKIKMPLTLVQPPQRQPRAFPRLEMVERRGDLLRASPLGVDVLGLNLTSGCAHQCAFCSVRAYPTYPGDDRLDLYQNAAQTLREELLRRRSLPRAIYLSPSSDPFPPFAEVQAETLRVLDVLGEFKIEAWVATRGFLRPVAWEILVKHKDLLRVTVPLLTVDRELQRVLEPWAAPPKMRLRQIKALLKHDIPTQVAVEPLIPGITDTKFNLEPLVESLAEAGVETITTGYLFLRPGIQTNLLRDLAAQGWAESVIADYARGPLLSTGKIAQTRQLPRAQRQAGYALLLTLAARHGMQVRVNGLTNPDFLPPRNVARPEEPRLRQATFGYAE